MDISEAGQIVLANNCTIQQLSETPDGLAFLFHLYDRLETIADPQQLEAVSVFCRSRDIQEKFQRQREQERATVKREWGEEAN